MLRRVWWLARFTLTLLVLLVMGYFIAAMGTEIGPLRAFNEPGVPGKYGYQFVMGFALVLGWALGTAVEAMWNGRTDRTTPPWELLFSAILPRLLGGLVIFFALTGIEFGFEALGVGLGGR